MENKSGIRIIGDKCLILPNEVGKKKGSIYIPEITRDREQSQILKGTLVDIGDSAFDVIDSFDGLRPKIGDNVIFVKYAGFLVEGKDGLKYRIVRGEDIGAIIE